MSDTVTLPRSEYNYMTSRITQLEHVVKQAVEEHKLPETSLEPPEGTEAWWVWAEQQADADIQAGRVVTLHNEEDINTFFDNL
jgi:hypothetical protein